MIWAWIIAAIAAVMLILFLFACFALRSVFGKRCEGNPSLKYFTSDDFKGLDARAVSFLSDKGQRLHGAVYTCSEEVPRALVVFAHGMGGGHRSYMTEINTFARAGFAVLAYDNTGTMASEGEALGSFYQAVRDLHAALAAARADEMLSGYKIILAGHSWGGYAVCQALSSEKQVAGAVAFSAPNSAAGAMCDSMRSMTGMSAGWLRPFFAAAAVAAGGSTSRHSSSSILAKTEHVPILLLHGDADTSVSMKNSPVSRTAVREKKNITCVVYEERAHNVYQTKASEAYLGRVFGAIGAAQKKYGKAGIPEDEKARLYDIDYALITEEDERVMQTVVDFMKKCVE